jgi:hypothetical protein
MPQCAARAPSRVEAQTLLAKAADLREGRQALLMASPNISERAEREFALLVRRRAAREPLAHLTGRTEFYSLEFEVSKDVLTPRPESELIVSMALETPHLVAPTTTVVDVGVGSGCLLLSVLTHAAPSVRGIGLDVSANALVVAQRNAVRLGMLARTRFLCQTGSMQLPLPVSRAAIVIRSCCCAIRRMSSRATASTSSQSCCSSRPRRCLARQRRRMLHCFSRQRSGCRATRRCCSSLARRSARASSKWRSAIGGKWNEWNVTQVDTNEWHYCDYRIDSIFVFVFSHQNCRQCGQLKICDNGFSKYLDNVSALSFSMPKCADLSP